MKDWLVAIVCLVLLGFVAAVFRSGCVQHDEQQAITKAQQEVCYPYVVLGSYERDDRYVVICGDEKQYDYSWE